MLKNKKTFNNIKLEDIIYWYDIQSNGKIKRGTISVTKPLPNRLYRALKNEPYYYIMGVDSNHSLCHLAIYKNNFDKQTQYFSESQELCSCTELKDEYQIRGLFFYNKNLRRRNFYKERKK